MTLYNSDENFWRKSVVRTAGWRILLVVCVTLGHLAPGSSFCRHVNELTGKFPDQKTSMCHEKLWISAVVDFLDRSVRRWHCALQSWAHLFMFTAVYRIGILSQRWQLYRCLHPIINDSFFYQDGGSFVATIRPERVAYARAGETLTRVPRMALGKIPLARSILYRPNIFYSFAWPASLYCEHYVYIHTYLIPYRLYMNYRCYQVTLQWNIFTQIGALRSVDWIFIVGAPVWRWLGEKVTLGRTFYCLLLKQVVAAAAQLLPNFLPYRIPGGGLN